MVSNGMQYISIFLVAAVAVEHLYIMVLEMFFWTKPRTLKLFGFSKELAEMTKPMAANQGLYNGFLSACLLWGIFHPNAEFGFQIKLFFLLCVLIAAVYGFFTVKRSILIMQGLPALLALCALLLLG